MTGNFPPWLSIKWPPFTRVPEKRTKRLRLIARLPNRNPFWCRARWFFWNSPTCSGRRSRAKPPRCTSKLRRTTRVPRYPSAPTAVWICSLQNLNQPPSTYRKERAIPNPSSLSKMAMREEFSRGRRHPEPRHPYRTEYARDRDRIIHARAFRRLEAKTQVFTTRYSDHFRNRLTHTLEVTQIARTVSAALGLNSELGEALALVHDIGHPPFGHGGERKLNELMQAHGAAFDHNLHALRIVEQFEHRYLEFTGLNLTFEVHEGIIKHSRDYEAGTSPELAEYLLDLD